MTDPAPRCRGCRLTPEELEEYVEAAAEENITPLVYLRQNEGTYNPATRTFWCTNCYVEVGMPSGKAPGFDDVPGPEARPESTPLRRQLQDIFEEPDPGASFDAYVRDQNAKIAASMAIPASMLSARSHNPRTPRR